MSIGSMRRLVCTMCAVVLLSGLHRFPGTVQGLNVLVTSTGSSSRVDVENDLSRSDPAFSLQKNIHGTRKRLRTTEPVEPSEAADEEEVADQEPIPSTWKRKTEGEKKAGAVTEQDDDMTVVDVATEDSGDVSVPSSKGGAVDGRDDDGEFVSSIEPSRAKAGTKSASVSRTSEKDGDGVASTSTSDAGEQSEEEAAGTDLESITSSPTTKKRKKKGSLVVKDTVTDDLDGNLDPALLPESKGTAGEVDSADESSDTISGAKVPRTIGATKSGEELEMIDVEGGEEDPSKNVRSKEEIPDPDPEQAAEEDSTVSKPDSKDESLGGVEEAGGAEGVGAVQTGKAEAVEEEEEEEEGNEEPVKKRSWLWTAGKANVKGKGKKNKNGSDAESMAAAAAAAEPDDFDAEEGVSPPSGSLSESGTIFGRTKGASREGAQSKEEGEEGAGSAATVVEGGGDTEGETFEKRTKPKESKTEKDGDVDPAAEEAQETAGGPDGDGTDAGSGTPAGGQPRSWTQKGKGKGKGKKIKKPAAEVDDTDVEARQEETDLGLKKKAGTLKSKKGGRKEGPQGKGDDDTGFANAEAPIGSEGLTGFAGSPGTGPSKENEPVRGEGLDDDGVAGGGQGAEASFLGEPTASKVVPDSAFVNAPSSGDVSEKEKSNGSDADHSNPAQSPSALIPNNTKNPSLPEGADSMASATPPRKRRGKDGKRRGGTVVAGGESPAPTFVPEGGLAGGLISPPSPSEGWGLDSEFSADPGPPPPGSDGRGKSSTNTSVPEKKGGLGTPSSLYSATDDSKSKPGTVGTMFEGASEDNSDSLRRGSSPSTPVDSESSPTGGDEGASEEMKRKDAGVSGGGKKGRDFPFGEEEDIPDTDDLLWAGSKPKADVSGLGGEGGPIGDTVPRYEPGTKSTTNEVATPVLKNGEEAPGKADFLAAASKVEEERGEGGGGGSYTTFLQKFMYDLIVSPVEVALAPYLTLTQALYVCMALLLLMAAGGCYCWATMCGGRGGRHGPGYRYDGLELGVGGDEERMSSKDLSVAFGQGVAHNGKWDDSWDEDWEAEAARKKKAGSESIGVPRQDSVGTTSIYELKKGSAGTSNSAKKKGAGSKLVVTKGKPVVDEGWEKEWE